MEHVFCVFLSWVEEDPKEIIQSVYECIERTCEKLGQLNIDLSNIKGAPPQHTHTHQDTLPFLQLVGL